MSHYTKKEITTIEEATSLASHYINLAQNLLTCFIESYFENAGDVEHLIIDLQCRPNIIESQLDTILHILSDGKRELDVFVSPEKLKYFFETVEKKKEIIKVRGNK
ncbi:MAG: hypothetical protein J6S14_05080 [Clostridia bacterium]|nr:hypothetical protein [Clostridia bacterium]